MDTHNLEDKNSFDDIPMVDLPEELSTGTHTNHHNTIDHKNQHESATAKSQFHQQVGSPSLSSIASTLAPSSPPQTPPTLSLQQQQGPPRLPPTLHLHPTAATSPTRHSSSPRRSQGTPQMMVLGKDSSDYRDMLLLKSHGDDSSNDKKQALLADGTSRDAPTTDKDVEEPPTTPSIFHKTPTTMSNAAARRQDNFDDEHSTNNSQKPAASKVSQWWGSLWTSSNSNNNDNNTDDYANMEQGQASSGRVAPARLLQEDDEEEGATVYFQPQQRKRPRQTTATSLHQSMLRKLPLPATKEDQIQQDCSFLYRSVEEDHSGVNHRQHRTGTTRNRSLRAVLDPPLASSRFGDSTTPINTTTTLYSRDVHDVLSVPDVSQFQAKYQQLNQTLEPVYTQDRYDSYDEQTDNYNDYAVLPAAPADLTLEEQQQQSRPSAIGRHDRQHSYVTDVTSQSSMFYQVNGRVLLRLPRDSVRLMVADPTVMEAGILSVIQTRPAAMGSEENDGAATHADLTTVKNLPRLEYCLTVPPNLYQQVVSDMQQCATRPGNHRHASSSHDSTSGGGIDLHFYASEHADIKIAIGIMAVIMFILGINTLVFDLS